MDLRVILQKTLTQISGITYMKEKKYIPSCSIIIYRLMLREISGSHASVEILLLKCDGKIQKPLSFSSQHHPPFKGFSSRFYKGGGNLDYSMHVLPCKIFLLEIIFSFTFIHHELTYLSMFLFINYRILFSKPNPRNSSYQV